MALETVTLKLSCTLLRDAQIHAKAQGVSVGELVRQLLTKETTAFSNKKTRAKPKRADDLKQVFSDVTGWADLMDRLRAKGFELRAMGTGLAIYSRKGGSHVCNTAAVGYRYQALVKRFGSPMPGHPHDLKWVAGETSKSEDFDVIDRHP